MLLLHLMMMNTIIMPMTMLLTMISCLKRTVFNHLPMMNVMNLSKDFLIIIDLNKILLYFIFRDEIIKENQPTHIPPRFVPKTNKPIPLALRRFLDQDDDDDEDMESNFSNNDDEKQTSKSKYTSYSMTSSVIRRNQGLQNIDDHFDKIFDEYDDREIGALDSHTINEQGVSIEDELVKQTVKHFEQQQMQT
jgi:hypothetical protein